MASGNFDGAGSAVGAGASIGASVGSVIPGVGTAVGAGVGALTGLTANFIKNKKRQKREKQRPQYKVNEEALDTVALAKGRAFGKDRGIQMAEENIDRDAAASIGQAKNISSNTGSILDTLRSINNSAMDAKRGLAVDEAQLRNQKVGELYNANNMISEEKDKAWNYNVNDPYQNKVQELRDRNQFNQQMMMKGLDMYGSIAGYGMGGGNSPQPSARKTRQPTYPNTPYMEDQKIDWATGQINY